MKENLGEINECIICGKADGQRICGRCGDPEMVVIHYNRLVITLTPESFFSSNIRKLLKKDGFDLLSTDECAGLVIRIKAPRGRIDEIQVFRV